MIINLRKFKRVNLYLSIFLQQVLFLSVSQMFSLQNLVVHILYEIDDMV